MFLTLKRLFSNPRIQLNPSISFSFQNPPAHLNYKLIQSTTASPYNLIVLHGLLGSCNNFRSLVSNPTINTKVNSYLLDMRNHGGSEHKPTMEIREMAGDVGLTRLLLGLGLRSFSMHPSQILAVKQEVLRSDTSKLRDWAHAVLDAEEPALLMFAH